MKAILVLFTLVLSALSGIACPVCERQQPNVLRGISHGTGPASDWDYIIIWTMVVIVVFTLYFSIKMLVKPGEKTGSHIKRIILNLEDGTEK
ncbi:hypothetical protein GCM10011386_15140 [Parapedobacter defluvii]|uniref:CcmD family protein n=1 Tax=Parapedobacter defluvii TaxID=2045106 RepID=A0ABQ1LI20_9SPHI|nr:hypothetical protein [Parapedobacter defluvii]GGC24143.1 hypothetical protein GCM10011386_15140 [Parapedobacter defluvii]